MLLFRFQTEAWPRCQKIVSPIVVRDNVNTAVFRFDRMRMAVYNEPVGSDPMIFRYRIKQNPCGAPRTVETVRAPVIFN